MPSRKRAQGFAPLTSVSMQVAYQHSDFSFHVNADDPEDLFLSLIYIQLERLGLYDKDSSCCRWDVKAHKRKFYLSTGIGNFSTTAQLSLELMYLQPGWNLKDQERCSHFIEKLQHLLTPDESEETALWLMGIEGYPEPGTAEES